MKRQWMEWSKDYAKNTGKCFGSIPSFGLPTDVVTDEQFKISTQQLSTHDVRTCNCWGAPIMEPKKAEAPSRQTKVVAETGDQDSLVLSNTENLVRNRVLQAKLLIKQLVDKIAVHDFRIENEKVVWSHTLPSTLLTLVRQLPDFLNPAYESNRPVQVEQQDVGLPTGLVRVDK